MEKFNDLSQLSSLKEKMELEDQEYYAQRRKEAIFADEFFSSYPQLIYDPTAFVSDPEKTYFD